MFYWLIPNWIYVCAPCPTTAMDIDELADRDKRKKFTICLSLPEKEKNDSDSFALFLNVQLITITSRLDG